MTLSRVRIAFAAVFVLLAPPAAHAIGNCSIGSVTLGNQTYINAAVSVTGTVNYTCTRTSNGADGDTITFNVAAQPGLFYNAGTRNAGIGSNRLPYGLAAGAAWGNGTTAGNVRTVTASFPIGGISSVTGSFPFTFTIAASQNVPGGLTYLDTVAIDGACTTAKTSTCSVTAGALVVSVDVPFTCAIASPPGTLNLAYTSFQPGTAAGTTSFTANCSNGAPYRMSLSPATGTVLGITYALKLGTSANSATDVSSKTTYNLAGTGTATTYYINATAAAAQTGACAAPPCTQLGPAHSLLLEY